VTVPQVRHTLHRRAWWSNLRPMKSSRLWLACSLLFGAGCSGGVATETDAGGGSATSSTASAASTTGPGGPTSTSTTTSVGPGVGGGSSSQGSGGAGQGGSGAGGDAAGGGGTGGSTTEPTTCAQAAVAHTNLGCDFWPTVTENPVWEVFDFGVVVTNAGVSTAEVTLDRGGVAVDTASVAPGEAATFYLPWVDGLKGPEADDCGGITQPSATAVVADGAYHLASTSPVAVYQFSPIEYSADGGPPGKDWSACPDTCGIECFSYTNDASMLLPTESMGSSFRVLGYPSWDAAALPAFLSITATADATNVTVQLGESGGVQGGDGVPDAGPGESIELSLDQGEVVQIVATVPGDFSGSLVTSDRPVQVLTGIGCVYVPEGNSGCDHLEETVIPAVALGKVHPVVRPTGAQGSPVGHVVRFVGHVNGTTLTYEGDTPNGAPSTLDAGQVVDLGVVDGDFVVRSSQPIGVGTFLLGAFIADPVNSLGDPSQSLAIPTERFRSRYELVAPSDFAITFIDVVLPVGASATLDGAPLGGLRTAVTAQLDVVRVELPGSSTGRHALEADAPFSAQVIGYGSYSSYQFPAGIDLP